MDEKVWDALVEKARREARINGDRRRLVGVLDGADRWVYVVQCVDGCRVCDARMERARG